MKPPCFLLHRPTVDVVYVYPVNIGSRYDRYANRFIASLQSNPAGYDHKLSVILNNGQVTREIESRFKPLNGCQFAGRDNGGWDVGAYQFAAEQSPSDLIVFFGSSTYFQRPGWLARMVQATMAHGPGLYGAMGNRGVLNLGIYPHIRTTAFWLSPDLMNAYPLRVTEPQHRYEFEHGKNCLTNWMTAQGLESWVVSWDGEYLWKDWDAFPNGMHRGDQSALLAGDRLTEAPYWPAK